MTLKSEGSEATVSGTQGWRSGRWQGQWFSEVYATIAESHSDFTKDVKAAVKLPDWPGWNFFVTFSPTGTPVGFEVIAEKAPVTPTFKGIREHKNAAHPAAAPAVTARFLRSLPYGQIERAAQAAFTESPAAKFWPEVAENWTRVFEEAPRPGRRGRGDLFYAQLAAQYVAKCACSSRPIKDLAEDLRYSVSRIRGLIDSARKRGLLTNPPNGRPGGDLTDKALSLLREE